MGRAFRAGPLLRDLATFLNVVCLQFSSEPGYPQSKLQVLRSGGPQPHLVPHPYGGGSGI